MPKLIKEKKNKFTVTSNVVIEDARLSFKARGLFQYMFAQSDNWQFYESELVNHSDRDGLASVRSGLKELEAFGYLKRTLAQNDKGRFKGYDWLISDEPMI